MKKHFDDFDLIELAALQKRAAHLGGALSVLGDKDLYLSLPFHGINMVVADLKAARILLNCIKRVARVKRLVLVPTPTVKARSGKAPGAEADGDLA